MTYGIRAAWKPWRWATAVAVVISLVFASSAVAVTVTVTTAADDPSASTCDPAAPARSCSLRRAIEFAQAGDAVSLPAGNYVLSHGELEVSRSITITGAGARSTTIAPAASAPSRVLLVSGAVTVYLSGVTIAGGNGVGTLGINAEGGGISNLAGATLNANAISVTGNSVSAPCQDFCAGGGIYNGGTLNLSNSTVSSNSINGVGTGHLSHGAGIYNVDNTATITNSTIAGNHLSSDVDSEGGGIATRHSASHLNLAFVTLADNTADNSGPLDSQGAGNLYVSGTQVTIANTIIARGSVTGGGNANCTFPSTPANSDQGYNLEDLDQCEFTHAMDLGDQVNATPGLGPLQNNGGPTDTEGLMAGSLAIDAANPSCASPTIAPANAGDQRGIPRPQNGRCDIGALEYVTPPAVSSAPTISGTPAVGQTLTCSTGTWTGLPPTSYSYQWLRDGVAIPAATGSTYTVQDADTGHGLSCQVTAFNGSSGGATSAVLAIPTPTPPAFPGSRLTPGSVTVGHTNEVALAVSCPETAIGNCVGTDTLRTAHPVAVGAFAAARKKVITLGRTHFSIRPGGKTKVKIKLRKPAVKLLKKKHKLKARETAVAHDSRGKPKTTTTLATLHRK